MIELNRELLLEVLESIETLPNGELFWELLLQEEIRKWKIKSKKRTEEEWLERIEKIPDYITRNQVACIVWWDYVVVWPKFEKYLGAWKPSEKADRQQTCKALMKLGYPERMAIERVKVMKGTTP